MDDIKIREYLIRAVTRLAEAVACIERPSDFEHNAAVSGLIAVSLTMNPMTDKYYNEIIERLKTCRAFLEVTQLDYEKLFINVVELLKLEGEYRTDINETIH